MRSVEAVCRAATRRGGLGVGLGDSDLIQEALMESHRTFARSQGRGVNELAGWLRTIVTRTVGHALRDHLGAAKRDPGREAGEVTGEVMDAGSNPRARAIRDEEMARFATCLERLPEDMQRVLLARHTGDVPYAELAQAIGRSEGAVRRLREEYDQG